MNDFFNEGYKTNPLLLTHYEVLKSFSLPVNSIWLNNDVTEVVELKPKDILSFGSCFKYYNEIYGNRQVNIMFLNGSEQSYDIGLSKEFFTMNSILVKDVSKQYHRNFKLNQIL